MANGTAAVFKAIPNNVLLCSVVFKFIVMLIGVLGNVTVIIHTMLAFTFASTATLLAIIVDRYLYIVKRQRYTQIMTNRRVFSLFQISG